MLGCAGGFCFRASVRGGGFFGGRELCHFGRKWSGRDRGGYGLYLWKSFRMVLKILLLGIARSSFMWLFTDASNNCQL